VIALHDGSLFGVVNGRMWITQVIATNQFFLSVLENTVKVAGSGGLHDLINVLFCDGRFEVGRKIDDGTVRYGNSHRVSLPARAKLRW